MLNRLLMLLLPAVLMAALWAYLRSAPSQPPAAPIREVADPGTLQNPRWLRLDLLAPALVPDLSASEGEIGVAVATLDPRLGFYESGGSRPFHTASVIKLPLMLTLMHQALRAGRALSSEERDLLFAMITYSDNDAATAVWDRVGGAEGIRAFLQEIGLEGIEPDPAGYWGLSTATPEALAQLMARLVAGDILDAPSRLLAMQELASVAPEQRWGVGDAIEGDGIIVGLKNGWYADEDEGLDLHSVAYVFGGGPTRTYTIAIMTHGPLTVFDDKVEQVEAIARRIHEALQQPDMDGSESAPPAPSSLPPEPTGVTTPEPLITPTPEPATATPPPLPPTATPVPPVSTPSPRAATAPPEAWIVAAAGDIACEPGGGVAGDGCGAGRTADLLGAVNPAAVLALGDGQYEDGALNKFQQSYEHSWGRFKALTRPVPGEHEYLTAGASGYFDYFGAAAGPRDAGYYSFDVGMWHVVALNSNCWAIGGCGPDSPQLRWLRADLAARPALCTLAYWHQPRFSSGPRGGDDGLGALWQALYDANVDVVLNAHDLQYERFAPQDPAGNLDLARGIRQFIAGTGGRAHGAPGVLQRNSEVRNTDTFGVLKLTLRPEGYDWHFVPETGKSFTDAGRGFCH